MGCNCKATQYVRGAKKYYGHESEINDKISFFVKLKTFLKACLIWIIILVALPIILFVLFFAKIIGIKRGVKIFKLIRINI